MPSDAELPTEEIAKSESSTTGTPRPLQKGWVSNSFFSKSLDDVTPQGVKAG